MIPTPKANVGDLVMLLWDENNGEARPDVVKNVILIRSENKNEWRVAYQCKEIDDFSFEGKEFKEVIERRSDQLIDIPIPNYVLGSIVEYYRHDKDTWGAGIIAEIVMEFAGERWVIEYYLSDTDDAIFEEEVVRLVGVSGGSKTVV